MKIALAQIRSVAGDIEKNTVHHQELIDEALKQGVEMIIFPELSLTGYEPRLVKDLAIYPDDPRVEIFQKISNAGNVIIGLGVPTKSGSGICISMLLFLPGQEHRIYSKKYLHADEEPYFVSGQNFPVLQVNEKKIALAICYELSVPAHAKAAIQGGGEVYLASVAKSAAGVEKATETLSYIAEKHGITALMVNSVGPSDDFVSAGCTAAWNREGKLIAQLDDKTEGILVVDIDKQEITHR